MCYRPLHISANNVYRNTNVSASTYDVPCGKCEACRDLYRSTWKCRLWHELEYTQKIGGTSVFLTFTYRDSCLPVVNINGVDIPCFNHSDVKTFLNRLKIRMYRLYGRDSYKYFIAMEYGKNTKRQHLHGLFFLSSAVNWRVFVELCRELWEYGFMFPKRNRAGLYVKDDGSDDTPLLRSLVKGSVYVSKYVTKDLSYYQIPNVDFAVKADKSFTRHFGPKHYQSNNIGISILDKVNLADSDNIASFLIDGISVPYSKSRIPVPRYIKKKLLYKNVKSCRVGSNGKFLYDSYPTSLNLSFGTILYERKASKLIDTIKKVFGRYRSLHSSFRTPVVDYRLLANYVLYFKHVNNNVLFSFLTYFDGDLDSLSDFSKVGFFYNLSKNNLFLKDNQYVTDSIHPLPYMSLFSPDLLDAYASFLRASAECEKLQVSEFKKRSDERDKVRHKYFYKYDKKLC